MLTKTDPEALHRAIAERAGVDTPASPVWTCLRRDGRTLLSGWVRQLPLREIITALLAEDAAAKANALEIAIPGASTRVDPTTPGPFANVNRGRLTYVFQYGRAYRAVAPTTTVATNRNPQKERDRFAEAQGIGLDALRDSGVTRVAPTTCLLALADDDGALTLRELYRGNEIVAPGRVTGDEAARMLDRMLAWARANQASDGRLPYKYWPSRGAYADSDNVIRQMLATLGLVRAARAFGSDDLRTRAAANLARNLTAYLVDCGDHAAMTCGGKGKLGATALAALCILEHAGTTGAHADTLANLRAGIDRQWQSDGAFRTFFWPPERNDNQNFYPGEALLFYAVLHAHTGDSDVLARAMASFRYYRAWHRQHPNPAFVPWHTQAYVRLYRACGEPELRDFVFAMNDWLCGIQQWGGNLAPDLWGRFYAPAKPAYGPPHAASTGVYLEGLGDAYALAAETGDTARAERYRTAIRRGLRSLRQLQVVSEADMFYMQQRTPVHGAIRTEAYNNEIRLDNMGHAMLALLNLPAWTVADPPATGAAAPARAARTAGGDRTQGAG